MDRVSKMQIIIKESEKKSKFVQVFQNIRALCESVSLIVKVDRMYLQGMDSANVSIFELLLVDSWFDRYEVETEIVIGINMPIFAKILSVLKQSQNIKISMENEDNLNIIFDGGENEFDKEFKMPLMNLDQDLLKITDLDFDLEFEMESKKFKSTMDELVNFGDNVIISYKNEEIQLKMESESGLMMVHIGINDVYECTISEDEDIECGFNMKYLQYMSNSYKVSNKVSIKMSKTTPMKCKYCLDDEEKNYLCYYLAPRLYQ